MPRMRLYSGLLWLCATSLGAAPIRINEPDWPPFFFPGRPMGQQAGIVKDIINICFEKMHYAFEFIPLPIERMQNAMQQGELDINFFSYKKERESFVSFGKELTFVSGYRPVIKKGSAVQIKSLRDFDRYKLGHTIGLRYSKEFLDYVMDRKKKDDIDETPTNESNIKKLLAGRIDVFVADSSSIMSLAAGLGLADQIQILDYSIQEGRYFLSLSKKSPRVTDQKAFTDSFDQCLLDLKKQGTYCEIFQKYQLPCPLSTP